MESLSCWRVEGLMSCHMAQIVMCMSCFRVNHTSRISVRWGLMLNVPSPLSWCTVLYLPSVPATCWTYNNGGEINKLLTKMWLEQKTVWVNESGCLWIFFVLVLQQKPPIRAIIVDWCRLRTLTEGYLPHTLGIMFSREAHSSILVHIIKIYLSLFPLIFALYG